MKMDVKYLNVFILGLGFMLVFSAFQTMSNIEKTMLDSVEQEHPGFTGEAYTSLAIVYVVFALCNWISPSVISVTGPRVAMVAGSLMYILFMSMFFWPKEWLLYLMSAVIGVGACIIWTGQGTFITRCSTKETISRNSGIFWAMFSCSMFFGNIFVYFQFQGLTIIDDQTRYTTVGVLLGLACIGVIVLSLLRPVPKEENEEEEKTGFAGAWDAFLTAGKLFFTRNMILLSFASIYTGIALSFYTGVYGSSVGFTTKISENPKQIVGLAGIFIGLGEVIGGSLFGILSSKTTKFGGRNPVIIAGFICHFAVYVLAYLNLPNSSPFGDTDDVSYFNPPRSWIALLSAFLLGFGDACFNTQLMSILGDVYAKVSTAAFALFKFTQSLGAAASFFYSSSVGLHYQLIILLVFGVLGTVGFCIVEAVNRRISSDKDKEIEKVEK